MATSFYHLFLVTSLILYLSPTIYSTGSIQPKALVVAVSKDPTTLQRTIKINKGTPAVSITVQVDLNGKILWVNCDQTYNSSTCKKVRCKSLECALANSPYKPTCKTDACPITLENSIRHRTFGGNLVSDVVRINSTDGSNPTRLVSVRKFLYACVQNSPKTLPKGVQGFAGLGRTKVSLPSQFSSAFKFANKYAMCLPSSNFTDGFIIFGDKPYNLFPGLDASTLLTYTPLITNPIIPSEYFIGVTSIRIFQKEVPLNNKLLYINKKGHGGTKISTVTPYTTMKTSIYKAVTSAFVTQLETPSSFAKRVNPIAPFTVCYDGSTLPFTRIGVVVPDINLVMGNEKVVWTISGTNSMVPVNSGNVYCLAFVDGGLKARTAIVIGSYQLENNLLQFDLVKSRLGFSSSLLFSRTRCDNFNFTSA